MTTIQGAANRNRLRNRTSRERSTHDGSATRYGAGVRSTPNLTPDPKTGRIYAWSEDAFVARFEAGIATGSPMPWRTFSRITDDDLRALYRYFRSLPPARLGQDR